MMWRLVKHKENFNLYLTLIVASGYVTFYAEQSVPMSVCHVMLCKASLVCNTCMYVCMYVRMYVCI